jgi:phosphoglycolate phosphatase
LTAPALLLLWDIDGTLLQRASVEHAEALRRALREVHGDHLAVEQVRHVQAAGRTDGAIARDLLLACGVEPGAIDAEVEAVVRETCRAYESLCPPDLSAKLAPGIAELLAGLAGDERFRLSLVTGNFEPVARLKLERAGIGHHFEPGQGGFGTDAEAREELPPVARSRAGEGGEPWPRDRTIVIGDTPNDIACARADGLRCVAVATGPYGAAELTAADTVVGGLGELEAALS